MVKESYSDYFYYIENPTRSIEVIEKQLLQTEQAKIEKKKLYENDLYRDPFKWHLYVCDRINCKLCQLIERSENVSQSDKK
jgi:hypothetical protein